MAVSVGSPEWYRQTKDVRSDLARLTINHHGFKAAADGELVFAPTDFASAPRSILDVATADGLWMRDVQATAPLPPHGQHTFTGTEINTSFFPADAAGAHTVFVEQDMNAPTPRAWAGAFDLVHMRLALLAARAPAAVLAEHVRCLKPGGWLVVGDAERACVDGGAGAGNPCYARFFVVMRAVLGSMGADADVAVKARGWLEGAGLEEVGERRVMRAVGRMNGDREMGERALESDLVVAAGMAMNAKGLGEGVKPYSDEELDALAGDLEKELRETGALFPMRFVWGRKPL